VLVNIKLPISSEHLRPWLKKQFVMFCSTMWIFILLFYPLTPVVWCFQQISIFLPLCNTAVWRWRNAVVGSALLSVCSSTVLPVAQLSGGEEGWIDQPGKLYAKAGPPLSSYFDFGIPLVFSKMFFCVFGVFSGDAGFYYSHAHRDPPSFLKFLSVA